jgi:hypothetical protein
MILGRLARRRSQVAFNDKSCPTTRGASMTSNTRVTASVRGNPSFGHPAVAGRSRSDRVLVSTAPTHPSPWQTPYTGA